MALMEVCHSEDALQAFLEYLVDPLLPAKSSSTAPSKDEQQSLAKQVRSVVLLHNYYHIKQQPQVESLSFDAFCKIAVVVKPSLLAFMNYMQKSDDTVAEDIEDQVSLTEKAVMDACDICKILDPSKIAPNIKGWPISKIAILLIDSQKEHCKLQRDCITNGVWSLIEKDLDASNQTPEVTPGSAKKRRYIRKPSKEDVSSEETGHLQVAFSAVKEVAGIDQTDLVVLESHVIYSQSKEKTSARFYIMQYNQVFTDNFVPIRDAVNSMQGPLVSKGSSGWTTTPVVEYFHILPYSEVISEWLCRQVFCGEEIPNSLHDSREEKCIVVDKPGKIETQVSDSTNDGSHRTGSINVLSKRKNGESCSNGLSDSHKEPQNMDVDEPCLITFKKYKSPNTAIVVQSEKEREKRSCMRKDSNGSASDVKFDNVVTTRLHFGGCGSKPGATEKRICVNASSHEDVLVDNALITCQSSSRDMEKLQSFFSSKEKMLSDASLRVLMRKRNNLSLQQRIIEDEIALCDKNIQAILKGSEDDLAMKLDFIIDGCNAAYMRTHERDFQHAEIHCSPASSIKKNKLSEAVLSLQDACQELDCVCHENGWVLPTYRVSSSDGVFQAKVSVRGIDFEYCCDGEPSSSPRDARQSAADKILAELRAMATS